MRRCLSGQPTSQVRSSRSIIDITHYLKLNSTSVTIADAAPGCPIPDLRYSKPRKFDADTEPPPPPPPADTKQQAATVVAPSVADMADGSAEAPASGDPLDAALVVGVGDRVPRFRDGVALDIVVRAARYRLQSHQYYSLYYAQRIDHASQPQRITH